MLSAGVMQHATLAAQPIHPLTITNLSPVILVQGLPDSHNPDVITHNNWEVRVNYDYVSNFTHDKAANERLFFDGETARIALSLKTRLFRDADIEFVMPYISHDGGSLDAFIENWHDFFGLPQNSRDNWPRNQLRYWYEKNGVSYFDLTEPVSGAGDAQLILGVMLNSQWFPRQRQLTFKTAVKFPSGDADKLTGSGGFAVSAWLTGDSSTQWFNFPGLTYYHGGIMWLQEGDILADQQRPLVMFGGIGTGVRVTEHIALQLQLDTHSAMYRDSSFNEINSYALMFTMGGNLKLSDVWDLDLAVVEDLYAHTAPDVVFHWAINGRF